MIWKESLTPITGWVWAAERLRPQSILALAASFEGIPVLLTGSGWLSLPLLLVSGQALGIFKAATDTFDCKRRY